MVWRGIVSALRGIFRRQPKTKVQYWDTKKRKWRSVRERIDKHNGVRRVSPPGTALASTIAGGLIGYELGQLVQQQQLQQQALPPEAQIPISPAPIPYVENGKAQIKVLKELRKYEMAKAKAEVMKYILASPEMRVIACILAAEGAKHLVKETTGDVVLTGAETMFMGGYILDKTENQREAALLMGASGIGGLIAFLQSKLG